jgi:hypothetical protein
VRLAREDSDVGTWHDAGTATVQPCIVLAHRRDTAGYVGRRVAAPGT